MAAGCARFVFAGPKNIPALALLDSPHAELRHAVRSAARTCRALARRFDRSYRCAMASATKQQFSLAHLTVLGCPPPEMTYIAARAGYDYVSIRPIYMGLPGEPDYGLADNPQMLRQTKRALAATGLRVHDIELARVYEGLHPTKYLPAMEVAAELGAKAVLSSIWGGEREFYIEKFGEICDLAKPFGLTVDLEYVPIAAV